MKQILSSLFLALILALSSSNFASAKTPPEVLKPYKEYRAALEAGDKDKAFKKAQEAWELAEKMLGDHKTTGDLAANFAAIKPSAKKYELKDYKARMKAHGRAIKLSSLYEDSPVDVELGRHIERIKTSMTLGKWRGGKLKPTTSTAYFEKMKKALDKYGRRGSTYEGDMEALRARKHEMLGDYKKALEIAAKAETIFSQATDNLVTPYPIALKLFKGNSLRGAEQPIKAALEYQDVMQNLEGAVPADHPFVKTAFTEWMVTRSALEDSGRLEEAEAAGLCECWPFENYKNKPVPLKRVPPVMPQRAKNSGYVTVLFDLNTNGKPENIRVTGSTDKVFEYAAAKSVEKWQYAASDENADPKLRKDVASRITFKLTNSSGKLLPENTYKAYAQN